jgi:NAD-dependent dihydropyrimidine dehydrogenase PreA subunit
MAYVITQPCIGVKDAACVAVCPVDVIHPRPDEPEFVSADQLYILQEDCIHCGLCALECPVNAIFADTDLPEEWKSFVEKNAAYFRVQVNGQPR